MVCAGEEKGKEEDYLQIIKVTVNSSELLRRPGYHP